MYNDHILYLMNTWFNILNHGVIKNNNKLKEFKKKVDYCQLNCSMDFTLNSTDKA